DICGVTFSEHTGGTATCKDKAVCDHCGIEYGELDSSNHAGGTEIRGESKATYLAEGYTGDTFCIGCGEKLSVGEVIPKLTHDDPTHGVEFYTNCSASGHNYKAYKWPATEFTMGSTQYICDKCGDEYWDNYTKKDTSEEIIMPSGKDFEFYITPNLNSTINKDNVKNNPILQAFLQDPSGTLKRMEDDGIKMYKIIDGAEQTVESKSENIVFRSDTPFKEFDQVMINGLVLDKKYYSVKKGSTIVTLNEDFAKEIPTGMHLFGIISTDGVAITTFTVDDKAAADNDTKSPQTGDNSMLWLWVALLFVSGGGVIGTTIVRKKEKRSEN
ncbi:MAG: LPXTG cell wall anchor domain-containing protein, partial [Ruminiclostridium sp.]|nr:LPXTG cell wall anchor domain-containing protein [Ruminiclostridium sp.]